MATLGCPVLLPTNDVAYQNPEKRPHPTSRRRFQNSKQIIILGLALHFRSQMERWCGESSRVGTPTTDDSAYHGSCDVRRRGAR